MYRKIFLSFFFWNLRQIKSFKNSSCALNACHISYKNTCLPTRRVCKDISFGPVLLVHILNSEGFSLAGLKSRPPFIHFFQGVLSPFGEPPGLSDFYPSALFSKIIARRHSNGSGALL